jgi:hypothetical protein
VQITDDKPMRLSELYKCDPNKNVTCSKTACYTNGGMCHLTKHEEYKLEEDKNNETV